MAHAIWHDTCPEHASSYCLENASGHHTITLATFDDYSDEEKTSWLNETCGEAGAFAGVVIRWSDDGS